MERGEVQGSEPIVASAVRVYPLLQLLFSLLTHLFALMTQVRRIPASSTTIQRGI